VKFLAVVLQGERPGVTVDIVAVRNRRAMEGAIKLR